MERGDGPTLPTRAVAYVRMSTDHQKYSTENQLDAIRRYAEDRDVEIVRIYEDAGRSGLKLEGREALQRLMAEVTSGTADFAAILVYDVSRWGRYQNPDEAAYHEHVCSRAGIPVHYCAEQFENDGSMGSNLLKSVKRVMDGEYSRQLSVKVFAGQCRLIELGFRQGGAPGYGLRRLLIDETRTPKGELTRGQRKSLQTDRVILVPGPPEEVKTVQRIYRLFVEDGRSEREIASLLTAEGLFTDLDRPWTRGTVHQVLTNEKYIGNNVYNHVSYKLKQRRVVNGPDMWVRRDGAFASIVDAALFSRARQIIENRSRQFSDEELIVLLRELFLSEGALSGLVIDEREDMPSSSVYRRRFGSLIRAYALVGYTPDRDYSYIEINRVLRRMHPDVVAVIVTGLEQAGGVVFRDPTSDLFRVNDEFDASIVIVRCSETASGRSRWKVRLDTGLMPDITIVVRMDHVNRAPLDYYLLPRIDVSTPKLTLAQRNGLSLDAYRFETLDPFYALAARAPLTKAA
jgi:DNA invertase Pin-like site-specific DNA recombinase